MECDAASGMFLTDNICHSSASLAGKCRDYATDGGCLICNDGFYKHEKTCIACDAKCLTCTNGDSCIACNTEHFMGVDGACKNKSDVVGCAVEVSSDVGCMECLPGYFAKDRMCTLCNETFDRCVSCTTDACEGCVLDHVISGGLCIPFKNITHCTAADGTKCTKCSFWHEPTPSGESCATHAVWWTILLAVIGVLFIVGGVVAGVVCLIQAALNVMRRLDIARTVCVFPMARSNVSFVPTKVKGVMTSTRCVVFDGAIPVDAESRALLCVGNTGKKRVRVQVVGKDDSEMGAVRVAPGSIILERGMACEFEVFITPLCSCTVDDHVAVVVREGGSAETSSVSIGIKAETEVTTKLHYNDVMCEKQIGEGSFGVVFLGTFRGNAVAVKRMKEVDASANSMDEFIKEVAMLDKFRCDQIVHFYGACFIPNHVMMVTEFAPCGSLMDCIQKKNEPNNNIKVKVMLDAAKGLEYLHNNGVLHRDIKPDNVLVFSLDEVLDINGKLTDFGSSRNVNVLMTNMTFTKGIGTPNYMAPEVLNKEKYKKAADIFSFGVMMFECFLWGKAYPKEVFKYPWDVVSFINGGKRLARPSGMRDDVYGFVTRCWAQDPKDRIGSCAF